MAGWGGFNGTQAPSHEAASADRPTAYIIKELYDHTRLAGIDYPLEVSVGFLHPIARGEPLTRELLALKPDPYYIELPEKGGLPDMFDGKRVWTVSEKVKKIIEELEPNVHTFIPVEPVSRHSKRTFGTYYLLYVGQIIDAVIIEESEFRDGAGRAGFNEAPVLSSAVLDGRLIAGKHLWRGGLGKLGGGGDPFARYRFCSDELKRRLQDVSAEGWRFEECDVKN
jgi:hypothetical protein